LYLYPFTIISRRPFRRQPFV